MKIWRANDWMIASSLVLVVGCNPTPKPKPSPAPSPKSAVSPAMEARGALIIPLSERGLKHIRLG